MATVADILSFINTLAPNYMKMDWDNVGLLCGSRNATVTNILVALDPFETVCQEAAEIGAELLVTHHPLIFRPFSAITDDKSITRAAMILCKNGISAINAHTNLDQAPGGVNDVLAQRLGLADIQVIEPNDTDATGQNWGLLRCGEIPQQTLDHFLATVKTALHCDGLRYVNSHCPVRKVAVGGGSCADELNAVISAGCDTFVTADVRYNQFWDAYDSGINLIDAGHFQTENPVVAVLADKIAAAFPEITVKISEKHRDCMKFY